MVQSTYGGRPRQPLSHDDRLHELRRALRDAFERGGPVLIPAFAADRFPAVLLDLAFVLAEPGLRHVPFRLHSSLARKLCGVYAKHLGSTKSAARWLSDDLFARCGLQPERDGTRLRENLAALLRGELPSAPLAAWRFPEWVDSYDRRDESFVVVAAGGMCQGGGIAEYVARHLESPRTTVLLTGICSASKRCRSALRARTHTRRGAR